MTGDAVSDSHRAEGVLTAGLTGNAASGKTVVADVWRGYGVEVIDADQLARDVVDGDRHVRQALAIEFGDEVLEASAGAETGAVRRQELARRAFATPDGTPRLNRIVHPPLLALLERRLAEARRRARPVALPAVSETGAGLVAVDAALIFEFGIERLFDVVVLVSAPLEARLERLRRRGLEEPTIQGLLSSQIPDAEAALRADHVIRNDASLEELRAASLDVLARILSEPAGSHPAQGSAR